MQWSYKTVHFRLKKEGLLGSAFLDETEIEISLNEFGKCGWELVSSMEVNDGLIAIFKQPFAQGLPSLEEEIDLETIVTSSPEAESESESDQDTEPEPVAVNIGNRTDSTLHAPLRESANATNEDDKIKSNNDVDVGSIRIL